MGHQKPQNFLACRRRFDSLRRLKAGGVANYRRCFGRFSEEATEYDSTVNHSVCKDKEACTLRMPAGAGGRKRTHPEGVYAQLAKRGTT